ncbi:hypothetical protein COU59_00460 [Candidatus Pacearchaeota archaeon CG10_big_fil_rev_8_21_14_0_10_34_12]|nr:MAG: hypothetical protein COU59_00460 [Candidatus Pacearchaeota archaeon CG10_big_fil_rev_8_21_14_0_10_34_12]
MVSKTLDRSKTVDQILSEESKRMDISEDTINYVARELSQRRRGSIGMSPFGDMPVRTVDGGCYQALPVRYE